MIIKKFYLIIIFISVLFFWGCEKESSIQQNRIVIGLSSDISSFNPLFAFSVDEGSISELLYLSLINFTWDESKGSLNPEPMLAKDWEWSEDSSSITFNLRDDVYWSDGVKFSAYDVVFSFDVYSDPEVNSRLYGMFTDFYTDNGNHIDTEKSFEIQDSFKLKINFLPNSTPTLPEVVFNIIPKHIFEGIDRKNLETAEENFKPVSNGPFSLASWDKNQTIRLKANRKSFLYNDECVDELIFKIIPDYSSRISQLKRNEIDLMELVKPEDVKELESIDDLKVTAQMGREYDYIGWSNIDIEEYNSAGKIKPHKIFGSAAVRKALTYAINRKEIVDEYLLGYGQISFGPVSEIFKETINQDLEPRPYDIDMAKKILKSEGWNDVDNDGILEKENVEFKFNLIIPSGNPRRNFAATIVKNNLKQAGINVNIESVESGVLIDDMHNNKVNAWMIGWYIPIPIDLRFVPYNFAGYSNSYVDSILNQISNETDSKKINNLYKNLQNIIYEDEPITFLYWVDNIVAHNSRIKNIDINPLGAIHHCWNWTVKEID